MKLTYSLVLLILVVNVMSIVDRTYFSYLGISVKIFRIENICITWRCKTIISAKTIENWRTLEWGWKSSKNEALKRRYCTYNLAFQTLSNEKERQKYERYGKDIFRSIKELTCINKMNPEQPKDERKSTSFKINIPVSIADIYNGTVVKAVYPKQTACNACQGTGAKSPKDLKPCSACAGKGFSLRDEQNFYGQRFQA